MSDSTVLQNLHNYVASVTKPNIQQSDYQTATTNLYQVFNSLITNYNTTDLNTTWEFFRTYQNTLVKENIALVGINSLTSAEQAIFHFLYTAFRECSTGHVFSLSENITNMMVNCAVMMNYLQQQISTSSSSGGGSSSLSQVTINQVSALITAAIAAQASVDATQYLTRQQIDLVIENSVSAPAVSIIDQPNNTYTNTAIQNLNISVTPTVSLYASLTINGVEQLPRILVSNGTITGLMGTTAGSAVINFYQTSTTNTILASTASFNITLFVVATNVSIANIPATAPSDSSPFNNLTVTMTPSNATAYVAVTNAANNRYGSISVITESTTSLPYFFFGSGSYTLSAYSDSACLNLIATLGTVVIS